MNANLLEQAVALAQRPTLFFVATADKRGLPHIAAAGRLTFAADGKVAVAAWFCPSTVANVEENRRVSLVIWDPEKDSGYQLLGETEKVEELAMMDGYIPGEGSQPSLPQVERQLIVRVEEILLFRRGAHSDLEGGEEIYEA